MTAARPGTRLQAQVGERMETIAVAAYRTYGMGGVVGQQHVYLVDDDRAARAAVGFLLRAAGYRVFEFDCAEAFLRDADPNAEGCIVLDMSMPGLNGLQLQRQLVARSLSMPVIFLSGQSNVTMCADAMRSGASDFLTKPVEDARLFGAVENAFARDRAQREDHALRTLTETRLATLTPREREVLDRVVAGRLNKQIAAELGTTEKTVKVHRSRGMQKMECRSVAELVRMMLRAHPRDRAARTQWPPAGAGPAH